MYLEKYCWTFFNEFWIWKREYEIVHLLVAYCGFTLLWISNTLSMIVFQEARNLSETRMKFSDSLPLSDLNLELVTSRIHLQSSFTLFFSSKSFWNVCPTKKGKKLILFKKKNLLKCHNRILANGKFWVFWFTHALRGLLLSMSWMNKAWQRSPSHNDSIPTKRTKKKWCYKIKKNLTKVIFNKSRIYLQQSNAHKYWGLVGKWLDKLPGTNDSLKFFSSSN